MSADIVPAPTTKDGQQIALIDAQRQLLDRFREDIPWDAVRLEEAAAFIRMMVATKREQNRQIDAVVGYVLLGAKKNTPHGKFEEWFPRLGISKTSAHRAMARARIESDHPSVRGALGARHIDVIAQRDEEAIRAVLSDPAFAALIGVDGRAQVSVEELEDRLDAAERSLTIARGDGEKATLRIKDLKEKVGAKDEQIEALQEALAEEKNAKVAAKNRATRAEHIAGAFLTARAAIDELAARLGDHEGVDKSGTATLFRDLVLALDACRDRWPEALVVAHHTVEQEVAVGGVKYGGGA